MFDHSVLAASTCAHLEPTSMTDLPASTLRDGRYVVIGVLGSGAQGSTLDAVDKLQGRPVAIKRFQVRGAKSWKDVELAEREARVLSSLSHPALPAYVEHFEEDGCLYLVMEKIEGERLSDIRARGARFSRSDVVRFLREVGVALDYLHGRAPPVIHRDIKPSNVIRRPDGTYALVDFGAVRDFLKPEGGSTVVGTFGYMAPEQFQSRAMPASDVYATAATALSMLTGREPEQLPHQGLSIDVRAALEGHADWALVQVLSLMLVVNPDQRARSVTPLLARVTQAGVDGADQRRPGVEQRAAHRSRAAESDSAAPTGWGSPRGRWHAGRGGRRWQHRRGGMRELGGHPLAAFAVLIGLALAQLAVFFGLRMALPFVLMLLSIFLGRGLRRAARATDRAGQRAGAGLRRAYVRFRDYEDQTSSKQPPARTRQRSRRSTPAAGPRAPRPRVRVSPPPPPDEALEDEPQSEPAEQRSRWHR
jgi:hypothetical protein